jgi:hypothetical protein
VKTLGDFYLFWAIDEEEEFVVFGSVGYFDGYDDIGYFFGDNLGFGFFQLFPPRACLTTCA